MSVVGRTIHRLLDSPSDARVSLLAIAIVGIARSLLEVGALGQSVRSLEASLAVSLTFYFYMYMTITGILALTAGKRFGAISNLTAIGLLFGVMPPLIDIFLLGGAIQRYVFFTEFSLTLQSPAQPFSETLTLWALIVSCGVFVGYLTRHPLRGFLAFAGAWGSMQALTGIVVLIEANLRDSAARQMTLSITLTAIGLAIYLIANYKRLLPSLKRANHALPHFGLALAGFSWANGSLDLFALLKALIIFALFVMLIIQNDYFDRLEDRTAGRAAGANLSDVWWTVAIIGLAALSLIRALPLMPWIILLILLLGYAYHHGSVRLKARVCLSYKVEGAWAVLAFVAGATTGSGFETQNPFYLPALLVFGGGTLLAFPKDWKDIESDKTARIPTIYVLAERAGYQIKHVHSAVCIAVAAATMLGAHLTMLAYGINLADTLAVFVGLGAGLVLRLIPDPKKAVEASYWAIGVYTLLLAWAFCG